MERSWQRSGRWAHSDERMVKKRITFLSVETALLILFEVLILCNTSGGKWLLGILPLPSKQWDPVTDEGTVCT